MREELSVMMDGELDADGTGALIARLKSDDDLARDWQAYHLIGDSLRESSLLSADFTARFSERLAAEPTVFVPALVRKTPVPASRRFVVLSAAASVAAVAMVGWLAIGHRGLSGEGQSTMFVAQQTQSDIRPVAQYTPAANDGMQDYLAAHREAAELQNVTFTTTQVQRGR